MARIYDKHIVATYLRRGIGSIATSQLLSVESVLEELGTKSSFPVKSRTIESWVNESSIPQKIDDLSLFTLIYYVLRDGEEDLEWVFTLLQNTSIPITNQLSSIYLRSLLRETVFFRDNQIGRSKREQANQHVNSIIERLFPLDQKQIVIPKKSQQIYPFRIDKEFSNKVIRVTLYSHYLASHDQENLLKKVYAVLDRQQYPVILFFEVGDIVLDFSTALEGVKLALHGRWNILNHHRVAQIISVSQNKLLHKVTEATAMIGGNSRIHIFYTMPEAIKFIEEYII